MLLYFLVYYYDALFTIKQQLSAAAGVLIGSKTQNHITLILASIQWQPVRVMIDLEIWLITRSVCGGLAPSDILDLLTTYEPLFSVRAPRRHRCRLCFTGWNIVLLQITWWDTILLLCLWYNTSCLSHVPFPACSLLFFPRDCFFNHNLNLTLGDRQDSALWRHQYVSCYLTELESKNNWSSALTIDPPPPPKTCHRSIHCNTKETSAHLNGARWIKWSDPPGEHQVLVDLQRDSNPPDVLRLLQRLMKVTPVSSPARFHTLLGFLLHTE